ncbi:MAG: 1-acyl-sn-glycerol-3-phosphate acyltransferase [Nanoarchaeota archaeon]|nr:1-acyl-sn-glycerol-3-phosphate acyltransferase [Nanoarchaeota archaeon]
MSLRRNNDFYDLLIVVSKILYYPFNKIKVSGTKNIPKKGPALLLPKHNLVRDVPIEGIIIRNECRRRAYFVMKDTLPRLLDYAGGIRVRRSKDVKETNYNMNKIIEKHNQKYNNNTLKLVGEAYKKGELVIVHPEGCSIDKKMLPLKKNLYQLHN